MCVINVMMSLLPYIFFITLPFSFLSREYFPDQSSWGMSNLAQISSNETDMDDTFSYQTNLNEVQFGKKNLDEELLEKSSTGKAIHDEIKLHKASCFGTKSDEIVTTVSSWVKQKPTRDKPIYAGMNPNKAFPSVTKLNEPKLMNDEGILNDANPNKGLISDTKLDETFSHVLRPKEPVFTKDNTPFFDTESDDRFSTLSHLNEPKLTRRSVFSWTTPARIAGKMVRGIENFRKKRPDELTIPAYLPNPELLMKRRFEDLQLAKANKNIAVIRTANGAFTDKRGKKRTRKKWPIVYSKEYDVHLGGLEKLHPFDVKKWRNIILYLKNEGMITDETISVPDEVDRKILLLVHTEEYLDSLKSGFTITKITEHPIFSILPHKVNDRRYLRPMRFQVGGSILAAELAIHRGWAINVGGGFHHASANRGCGFSPYADVTLMIKWLFTHYPDQVRKAMIVDLDAHQGNGHETDFLYDFSDTVYILDAYNKNYWPKDVRAKRAIRCNIEFLPHTPDEEYLYMIETHLENSLNIFHPDIIVYNAGTDILKGDFIGQLDISPQGIIDRDEIVFSKARKFGVPIVMVTSGGYLKKTATIIAKSILNLKEKGLIPK